MLNKVIPAEDAIALIQSGDSICTSGFVGIGVPELLLKTLKQRYIDNAEPSDLTLMFAAGQGDGVDKGLNHLAQDGLLKRVIGGHWGLIPKIANMALEGRIEGYNLPQGVISQLYREIAARRPGLITRVGLGTFVDPRQEGGKIGAATTVEIVEHQMIHGQEYLFYPCLPLSVALLRGSTADESGNITMEREALILDNLAMAMAARNSGGIVIVQVENIVKSGSMDSRQVAIPGALVDAVVVADKQDHLQTFSTDYSAYYSNQLKCPEQIAADFPMSERKIISRRCAMELPINAVVNLGIGMPEGVAAVAAEEKIINYITLTTEPGTIGGRPASGLDFGAAINADAIIAQNQQFDFYDGGGLDLACLGMAQVDRKGNINVSRFGNRLAGAGGFINISQNARKLIFAGTFTTGGLKVSVAEGRLHIEREGRARKFLEQVEQITYNAQMAVQSGQPVLYVTERAVFELTGEGIRLIEYAPGIDIERDIVAHMDFIPIIDQVRVMDEALFRQQPMELVGKLFDLRMAERIELNIERGILFLDFQDLKVRSGDDIDEIYNAVIRTVEPLKTKVDVVVNYDRFEISDDIADDYARMVARLEMSYYHRVSRYTNNTFLRMKLNQTLTREVRPSIFKTRSQAISYLE